MLSSLFSLGTLATLVICAFGVGRPMVRWIGLNREDTVETAVWSIGLGLVTIAEFLALLAHFQGLTLPVIGAMTVAATFWGVGELVCAAFAFRTPRTAMIKPIDELTATAKPPAPSHVLRLTLHLGSVAVATTTLISAAAPPTSDAAISRYLELPKTMLHLEGFPQAGGNLFASSPPLASALFSWAMAIDGPVSASLLAWFFGILLAAATTLLATPLVGRVWAKLAGISALLAPGVAYQMSAPLDDLLLAAFGTLALAAWWRGTVELQGSRWFFVAGLFLGGAFGTKAIAVAFFIAVAVVWCFELRRHTKHRREVAIGAMRAAVTALLTGGIWYARGGLAQPLVALSETGSSLLAQSGPWFVAIVPGLVLTRRLRGLQLLVGVAVCFAILSRLIFPEMRYFALLIPLLAVMSVWVWMELVHLPQAPRRVAMASLAVAALTVSIGPLVSMFGRASVACGWQRREDYLRLHVPTFRAAEICNRVLRSDSRLLSQDPNALYFDCPVETEAAFRTRASESLSSTDIVQELAGNGFTHVLLCEDESQGRLSVLSAAIDKTLNESGHDAVLPLTEYHVTSAAGVRHRYRLLLLRR